MRTATKIALTEGKPILVETAQGNILIEHDSDDCILFKVRVGTKERKHVLDVCGVIVVWDDL